MITRSLSPSCLSFSSLVITNGGYLLIKFGSYIAFFGAIAISKLTSRIESRCLNKSNSHTPEYLFRLHLKRERNPSLLPSPLIIRFFKFLLPISRYAKYRWGACIHGFSLLSRKTLPQSRMECQSGLSKQRDPPVKLVST